MHAYSGFAADADGGRTGRGRKPLRDQEVFCGNELGKANLAAASSEQSNRFGKTNQSLVAETAKNLQPKHSSTTRWGKSFFTRILHRPTLQDRCLDRDDYEMTVQASESAKHTTSHGNRGIPRVTRGDAAVRLDWDDGHVSDFRCMSNSVTIEKLAQEVETYPQHCDPSSAVTWSRPTNSLQDDSILSLLTVRLHMLLSAGQRRRWTAFGEAPGGRAQPFERPITTT